MSTASRNDALKATGISLVVTILLEMIIGFLMDGMGALFALFLFFPIYVLTREKIAAKRQLTR